MKFFLDYERSELAKMFSPPFRATQIFKAVYQHGIDDFESMTDLPKAQRASLATEWDIKLPAVHKRFDIFGVLVLAGVTGLSNANFAEWLT